MRHPLSVSHLQSAWPAALLSLLLAVFVVSCEKIDDRFPPYDNTAEVEAFWKSKPDLFQWKTPADIPADLKWESGADVPEFGDPAAKKGGVYHDFHPTFPATYRVVGPDASGTFRGEHHDQVMMWMAFRHPDADAWVPSIADQWAYSADKKKIYFRMDPKASFSDGTPITVEDFFMTFFIMLSPHIQDPWYNDYYFKEFESITKYDEHTFSYTLKETYPDPMWIVADVQPMSRKFYKEFGPDFPARYQWRKAPSTGAYDFDPETDVTRGRRITLNRVKNWWAKDKKHFRYIYNVDKMDYRIIASQDKAFEDFRQGKLDFFVGGLPRYWYDKAEIPEVYKGYIERHVFFNEFPQVSWAIRLNESKPPLDNQDVRIGINYAMNLQKVLEVDFRGDKTRMNTTQSGFGRYTNPSIKARPFDPVKAREHFAAAGYAKSGPDGILMNAAGKRLSLTLSTFNSGTVTPIMLRLKEEAKKAGLEVIVEGLDTTQLYKKMKQKNHEMGLAGFGAQPPYPRFWEEYHGDNAWKTGPDGKRALVPDTNNITMTSDPALDVLIDKQRKASTVEEVQQLSWQLAQMIHDRANTIPLWESSSYRYFSWRWMRWPKTGNAFRSQLPLDARVFWIDEDIKKETQEAMKEGSSFGESLQIHDSFVKSR